MNPNIPLSVTNFIYGLCSAYFLYEAVNYWLHRHEQQSYRTMAAIMAFWFLLLLKDPIYTCIDADSQRHLYRTLLTIDMSAVFSCVFFVVEVLSPLYITWRLILKNAAAYIVLLTLYAITGNDIFFNLNIAGMVVYCCIWAVRVGVLTRRYHYIVRQNFSESKMRWMWRVIVLFFAVLAIWSGSCYTDSAACDAAYSVFVTGVWMVTNWHYRSLASRLNEVRMMENSDDTHSVPSEATADYSEDVARLFGNEKLHRNHSLTINDVVKEIGTNRSYFSAWLNNSLKMNFYDFVNSHRIADAERLMADNPKMPQREVAETVGFNSLSTFHRAFKKWHGKPSRILRQD